MPLNYSKWDQLELSDDSDIEGHPNVDKRSLIRWKQRDIHEKREMRKLTIERLTKNVDCNTILLPRVKEIATKISDTSSSIPAPVYINNLVQQIETNPSRDCPPGNDPSNIEHTYDGMILSLLRQASKLASERVKASGAVSEEEKQERLSKELISEFQMHVKRLGETIEKDKKEVETLLNEQKKHITSDDIHEGFESKYVPPPPAPAPVPHAKVDKPEKKKKVTEIEVLNPKASSLADDDELEEELPELTPSLEAFSKIPLKAYEKSFEFIQEHRDVVVPGASDALLVAAFKSQSEGRSKYAKQCVHQSLLLQYCEKLGPDGVRIFFKKMISGDKRAEKVFVDDMENTYNHLVTRVNISKEEAAKESQGKEQIQLVPEDPNQKITFDVPDGPPPEEIRLEGEGVEKLDIEEVRKLLQFKWDVFNAFPKDLQEALKEGTLERVNKVLGDMDVEEAEAVVHKLDIAQILNFADGGIRDETGKGKELAT